MSLLLEAGVLLRSFLVQASWNFRGMQNLGFATMTLPALRALARRRGEALDPEEAAAQASFFNTHPYLAGSVAAMVVGLRERTPGAEEFREASEEAREVFMGPLGALGDDFFWAALRPLAGAAGVILAMAGRPVLGVAVFFCLYNLFHLKVRWLAVRRAWDGPESLLSWLAREDFPRKAELARRGALLLLVALPFFWAFWDANPIGGPAWLKPIAAVASLALLTAVTARLDPRRVVLLVLGISLAAFNLLGLPR